MTVASDFVPSLGPTFPRWVRYASYVPLYGLAFPLVKLLEAVGVWPAKLPAPPQRATAFDTYAPTSADVFACSYFKSGTTWLMNMITQIAHRGAAEFDNIHHVVPWPDFPMRALAGRFIPLTDDSPRLRSPTGLRAIKTHLALSRIPFAPEARYVAVVRDPKDVCVSGYHFQRAIAYGPLTPSVGGWVDYFTAPNFFLSSWARHLASYWAVRDEPNVLLLTYEEMRADHAATIARLAAFMGVELSPAERDEVIARTSFADMKSAPGKFDAGQIVPWGRPEGIMVRRGESGGSGELLTPEMQARIDARCAAELKELGCDFPYEETYGGAVRS